MWRGKPTSWHEGWEHTWEKPRAEAWLARGWVVERTKIRGVSEMFTADWRPWA